MNEVEFERMQESAAIGAAIAANLRAIFQARGVDSLESLGTSVERSTTCGAWLAIVDDEGVVYPWPLDRVRPEWVRSLMVGASVEGVDEDVLPITVDLADEDLDPAGAVAAFEAAVAAAESEAAAIWRSTHGCDVCRAHWRDEGAQVADGEPAPVWNDCPNCCGDGVPI